MKNPCIEIWIDELKDGIEVYTLYPYWMTRRIDYHVVSACKSTPDWTTYQWNEQGRAVKIPKMSLEDQVKDLLG